MYQSRFPLGLALCLLVSIGCHRKDIASEGMSRPFPAPEDVKVSAAVTIEKTADDDAPSPVRRKERRPDTGDALPEEARPTANDGGMYRGGGG